MFLRHLVPWPSTDIHEKINGNRPRGTPASGALNAKGVARYSDFGPIKTGDKLPLHRLRILYRTLMRCINAVLLLLITNRKSYISFRLVPKSVTLNDRERRNGPYFALFHPIQ